MTKAKRFQARKYESELERWGKLNDKKVSKVTPHLQEHLKIMSISLTVVVLDTQRNKLVIFGTVKYLFHL